MQEFSAKEVEKRASNPIEVRHQDLERTHNCSMFRSKCPKCREGYLLVKRDPNTCAILTGDNCILCGQAYIYTDILPDKMIIEYKVENVESKN